MDECQPLDDGRSSPFGLRTAFGSPVPGTPATDDGGDGVGGSGSVGDWGCPSLSEQETAAAAAAATEAATSTLSEAVADAERAASTARQGGLLRTPQLTLDRR